jgi:DNA-binding HxlR family transcriptional regulator
MPPPVISTAAITENLLKRKWSGTILRYLNDGTTNPEKIMERENALSQAALVERLRTMLRYSLITRHRRSSPQEMAEYRITTRGRKILSLLNLIDEFDRPPADPPRLPPEVVSPVGDGDSRKRAGRSPSGPEKNSKGAELRPPPGAPPPRPSPFMPVSP